MFYLKNKTIVWLFVRRAFKRTLRTSQLEKTRHIFPFATDKYFHLQFAEDTLLLWKDDAMTENVFNMVKIIFEDSWSVQVNWVKSSVFGVNLNLESLLEVAQKVGFKSEWLPFSYLLYLWGKSFENLVLDTYYWKNYNIFG